MNNPCKVRAKKISCAVAICILSLLTFYSSATYNGFLSVDDFENQADTVPVKKNIPRTKTTAAPVTTDTVKKLPATDTTRRKDSVVVTQKIDTLNYPVSKDALDAPIEFAASDSGVLNIPTKQFILYGKSSTKYLDNELNAATIKLDQQKQLLVAYGDKDSTGSPYDKPKFVQGGTTSLSDSIFYNMRSQKGLTKNTYLQEGEMYIQANTIKKVSDDILYAWRGRFTTCNLDTPHFAFRTRKMKIINNKLAVSGPAFPEFEGVPIPVGIPFGIYPLNKGRHSGILAPTFAANQDYGLGLEGLGYYKALNDFVDLTVRTNIYSYGGWNLNTSSRYTKRYRYDGGLTLSLQNTKYLNRAGNTKDEFTRTKTFMVGWNHSINSKARPGTNFSANVNAGSTMFNRFIPNNANLNFQNQLTSSINYSKDWDGKYNLSLSANHTQNNLSRLINVTLPTATFSAVTVYPFERKNPIGEAKWYEKLGIGYTGNLQNQISFYDSAFNLRKLLDTAQWGATHSIPITLSLPSLGPVQISPGVSYNERWFGQAIEPFWNDTAERVETRMTRGFYTERQASMSLAANTRIFGTYLFRKPYGLQAIRHEVRPSISASYTPDLNQRNFTRIQVDSVGNKLPFSTITGSLTNGDRRFAGLNFGIDNTLEMKTRSRSDTSELGIKKVRLIDGFSINSSYNFLADSFRLQPISMNFRSTLFEKVNITAYAVLDPYITDNRGFRRDQLLWTADKFSLGRITNGNIAISTQFQSKSKDGKNDRQRLPQDNFMTPDEQMRQLDYVRSNPAEFADFNIPWSLQVGYSLSFSRQFVFPNFSKLTTDVSSNVTLNGDFSLTSRWKMGGSTDFNFNTSKIQYLTMFISREMHCWQMSINVSPVGLTRYFSVTISPKSGILRDLKINRTRSYNTL